MHEIIPTSKQNTSFPMQGGFSRKENKCIKILNVRAICFQFLFLFSSEFAIPNATRSDGM
jgi:hypothetical protein